MRASSPAGATSRCLIWDGIPSGSSAVHPLFDDIADASYFYFVHSYYVSPDEESGIAGRTDYGI
ncbi:MAG: hypothetical protein MZV70_02525, partial [Desulfobacterales bacterium]|nr:hypothetical protein [Desulfobacterales bacterium]